MPKKPHIPQLVHHKPSGHGRVRLDGKDVYLGPYGTDECEEAYRRAIAEWLETGEAPGPKPARAGMTVNELLLKFLNYAETYYVKDGELTDEFDCYRSAIGPLKSLYGTTRAADFGPLALKQVREQYVEKGWCRGYVNRSTSRIKRIFRWGCENEMVPASVVTALACVAGLKPGRTAAPDYEPRRAVPDDQLKALKEAITTQRSKDLVELQLLTAARPGELLSLTTAMLDRSGDVWVADLSSHKTRHHGKARRLYFGPKCQLILRRYLDDEQPDRRLFSYTLGAYRKAVKKASGDKITPHVLRHTAATRLEDQFGREVSNAFCGHASLSMTDLYTRDAQEKAKRAARRFG